MRERLPWYERAKMERCIELSPPSPSPPPPPMRLRFLVAKLLATQQEMGLKVTGKKEVLLERIRGGVGLCSWRKLRESSAKVPRLFFRARPLLCFSCVNVAGLAPGDGKSLVLWVFAFQPRTASCRIVSDPRRAAPGEARLRGEVQGHEAGGRKGRLQSEGPAHRRLHAGPARVQAGGTSAARSNLVCVV